MNRCFTYSLKKFFLMWTIFKVFIEFVAILFLFYVLVFGQEACAIANQRWNPHLLHWKVKS